MKHIAFVIMMALVGNVSADEHKGFVADVDGDFLTSFMDGLTQGPVNEVCYEREMQYLMGNGDLYGAANAMAILRSIDPMDPECVRGAVEAATDYQQQLLEPLEDEFEEYVAN